MKNDSEKMFPGEKISMFSHPRSGNLEDIREGRCEVANATCVPTFNKYFTERRISQYRSKRIDLKVHQHREFYKELLIRAYGHSDQEALKQVASYREFILEHSVSASPFAMRAFQQVPLQPDEIVQMMFPRPRHLQQFSVSTVALDGTVNSDQWRDRRSASRIEMEMIGTDRVQYPEVDLQLGDISVAADVEAQLREDLDMKIDDLAKAQIDNAETASGLRDILDIHPKVLVANIPDGNYLDLTNTGTYGAAHKITLPRIKAILNHIVMVGAVDPTRAITPSSFVISPRNMQDVWDFVSLVSGYNDSSLNANPVNVVPDSVRENIFNTGAFSNAWGYTFQWESNSQLDVGRMYVFTNQPIGWMFTKPNFDKHIVMDSSNSMQHAEKGIGEQMFKKAVKFYVPDLWKHNIVIVDF